MLRIYGLAAAAGLGSAAVNALLGDFVGLVASGFFFGAVFYVLLLVFERDQLQRAWDMVRGRVSTPRAEVDAPID